MQKQIWLKQLSRPISKEGGLVFNKANSLQIQALKEGDVSQFKHNLSEGQDLFKMVSHNSAIN